MPQPKKDWNANGPYYDVEAILRRAGIAIRTVEMCENLLKDPLCTAADRAEIEKKMYNAIMKKKLYDTAMLFIKHDPYFDIMPMRYLDLKRDIDIARALNCDPATVRRNGKRLLFIISDFCRDFIA